MKKSNSLKYVILPAKMGPTTPECADIYNRVYAFWKTHWNEHFSKTGNPSSQWTQHFLRQDFIGAILEDQDVVGCLLHTSYHLEAQSVRDSEYLHYFAPSTIKTLEQARARHFLSMEYLFIDPKWRRTQGDNEINYSFTLLGYGTKISAERNYDVTVALPIIGAKSKVDEQIKRLGGEIIQPGIQKYGYELAVMVVPRQAKVSFPNTRTEEIYSSLWETRSDYSRFVEKEIHQPRSAA